MKDLIKKMNDLLRTNKMERIVATTMLAATKERIFDNGKDADGNGLGNYSDGYLAIRRKTSWGGDPKIILQGVDRTPKGTRANPNKRGTTKYKATGQMFQDWSVIPSGDSVGLGFKNKENAEKSEYVEKTYNKKIFSHTKEELELLDKVFQKEIKNILKGI